MKSGGIPTTLSPGGTTKFLRADGQWQVPPGTGGGLTQIAQVVTTGSATTVTFSSIPGTYTSLRVVFTARDTNSSQFQLIYLKINSDATAANYSSAQYLIGQANTAAAGTNNSSTAGGVVANVPGVFSHSTPMSSGEVLIPGYAATVFWKQISSWYSLFGSTGSSYMAAIQRMCMWHSTAAITDLVFSTDGTAFVDGSTFTLYGMA